MHVGSQLVHTNSVGKGVIGVVQGTSTNLPASHNPLHPPTSPSHSPHSLLTANWLQPTHNKQDFYLGENKAKQYDLLISALGEKLKVVQEH